ncbi:MAG: hypothetical protein RIK87_27855 [Fuerstiella sp.]
MSAALVSKPLAGHVVGISISNGDPREAQHRGFDRDAVNRVVRNLSRHLLSQGARLTFGHDWRPNGVMAEVLNIASNYSFSSTGEEDVARPMVSNCVAWPDEPYADPGELSRLKGKLSVERIDVPDAAIRGISPDRGRDIPPDTPQFAFARACALTAMRQRMAAQCTARICLGGKTSGSSGRCPGVIEEAMFAIEKQHPLYLSAIMGGATAQLIDAVRGQKDAPETFARPRQDVQEGFDLMKGHDMPAEMELIPPNRIWSEFRDLGVAGLSDANGLSPSENEQLFDAATTNEVVRLVTYGLSRTSHGQS